MKISKMMLTFAVLLTHTFITIGQISSKGFQVVKSGQGKKSLLFIPGFTCSGEVWNETKTKFEPEYTCYALTMAGFAGTTPQPDPSFKKWENQIVNFIREENLQKPVIIGHSMGGALALAIAADYPDLAGKIVVIDALPCISAFTNPNFKVQEKPDCSVMENQMKSLTDEQFYLMQKMSVIGMTTDTSKYNMIVQWSVKSDRKTFTQMYCDFLNTDLRESTRDIQCPVLVLLQPNFKNMKTNIEEQYKSLKTLTLQFANKGLHFIMYDDKEWYFEQLQKFLTQKP